MAVQLTLDYKWHVIENKTFKESTKKRTEVDQLLVVYTYRKENSPLEGDLELLGPQTVKHHSRSAQF